MLFSKTWGVRFFELLEQQAARQNAGEEIHWYHKMVLDGIGDLAAAKRQFELVNSSSLIHTSWARMERPSFRGKPLN